MNNEGITIESFKDLNIKATGNIKMEGMQISVNSNAIMELKGSLIKIN